MYPESNLLQQNAKMQAEQSYRNSALGDSPAPPSPMDMCGQAQAKSQSAYSLRHEAEKRSMHHSQEASKAAEAANFFHLHPEFEEFIRLVRSGSIQF
jgi:hypothetical protein